MRLFKRKKREIEQEKLEKKLDAALCRVEPRQEFIHDLRGRLMKRFVVEVPDSAVEPESDIAPQWLVAGGVAGTVLMLIMSLRGLLSIVGLVGLLVKYLSHRKQEPASQMAH